MENPNILDNSVFICFNEYLRVVGFTFIHLRKSGGNSSKMILNTGYNTINLSSILELKKLKGKLSNNLNDNYYLNFL